MEEGKGGLYTPVMHGGWEKEVFILPGRGSAPASHGVRWRQRRVNGKGWTVGEIPTLGGRYFKHRPPLGPCQPWD